VCDVVAASKSGDATDDGGGHRRAGEQLHDAAEENEKGRQGSGLRIKGSKRGFPHWHPCGSLNVAVCYVDQHFGHRRFSSDIFVSQSLARSIGLAAVGS